MPLSGTPLFARLRGFVMAAAGIGLIAASITWDFIRGADSIGFGRKQLAGSLAGAALLGAGIWLGWIRRPGAPWFPSTGHFAWRSHRWILALATAAIVTGLVLWLSHENLIAGAAWLFWCYVAALCLLLPWRFGWQLFLAVGLLNLLLAVITSIKVALTGLPLTMLDIRIALANPSGLWEAMRIPQWTRFAAMTGIAVVVFYLSHEAWAGTRQGLTSGDGRRIAKRAAGRVICIIFVGILASVYFQRLFNELHGYRNTWDTTGVAAMAAEVGVLPYLAYSESIESTRTGDFFRTSIAADPPSVAEIRDAVQRHIDFGPGPPVMPNIVIVLAESTFDPNAAFRLDHKRRSSLFESNDRTVAVGPFRVNVIGGGTWVTEFETITGLDSRLFGYSGYYSHSSLSPYVSHDLFTYLEAKGYRSSAFFPNEGDFYNYRNAYKAYGADRIFDNHDQGHPDDWVGTDTQVIDDFKRIMGPDPEAPFLSYVLLIENHGPHRCRVTNINEIPVRLKDTSELEPNCMLHEYLRRLASTESAFASLISYLREVEARRGRPFLVAIFGDHQPYSFTGTEWSKFNFGAVRTAAPLNQTFYQLLSSAPRRIKCCLGEIPATLLPTLISSYAARDADDVYLGVNLWLYERCGPDAISNGPLAGLFNLHADLPPGADGSAATSQRRASTCASAYASTLTALRKSGIFVATAN